MKREQLAELGLEKDAIDAIMKINGDDVNRAKADVDALRDKLEEKDKAIADLNDAIKGFEGTDETIQTLQDKVAQYEQAEKDRKQAEKDAEADKLLTENILNAMNGREFVNDLTKQGIVAQVKAELAKSENKGKGAGEIFDALTKDVDGIFKNPQQEKLSIAPTGANNNEQGKKEFRNFF